MDDLVENFMAITAAPRETAEMFMEMCGYDIDSAIQIYFENGGNAMSSSPPASSAAAGSESDNALRMLFGCKEIPQSWRCQGICFDYSPDDLNQRPWSGVGIVQVFYMHPEFK